MSDDVMPDGEILVGRDPTPEEKELIEWALESNRNSIALMRESLRFTATISASMMAVCAAFAGAIVRGKDGGATNDLAFVAAAACLFLVALGAALFGAYPILRNVPLVIEELRAARADYASHKTKSLVVSAIAILAGFFLVFCWIVFRIFH